MEPGMPIRNALLQILSPTLAQPHGGPSTRLMEELETLFIRIQLKITILRENS
jgi:hypothetical protein